MKKIILTFTMLLSTALFSLDCDYKIDYKDQSESFTLFVETTEKQPYMGNLMIENLQISRAQNTIPGVISLNVNLDPDLAHLPAFGIQKGSFKFFKGDQLPQISEGQYEIIINKSTCGYIILSNGEGEYFSLEKSFQ